MIKNRKILGVFTVVFLSLYFFSSCKSNFENSPSKTGRQVFNILKTLDALDEASFRSHFNSLDVFKKIIKNVAIEEDKKSEIMKMDYATYDLEINGAFRQITMEAENNYIRWATIEYVYYEYNYTENEDLTAYYGDLYFKN